jgi:hypothetical protein
MKSSILFFVFSYVFFVAANATECEGYIIKSTGDTIKGTVDVPMAKALLNKKGVDYGAMWDEVKFGEGTAKPRKMKAGDIAGFGFTFEGQWHHFEVLDMQKNTGQKAPKLLAKALNDFRFFVERIYDGALPIYKQHWNSEKTEKRPNFGGDQVTGYEANYDLYVKNTEYGFVEIAPTTLGGNKKLKEFLKKYLKLEDGFLTTVDEKAKFTDAEEILKRYNDWKKTK